MKNYLKVLLSFVLAFALIGPAFTQVSKAEEFSVQEAQEIEDLAEQLEFMYEKASIKDELGNIVGINIEMIEAEFGTSPELEMLKRQIKMEKLKINKGIITIQDPVLDRCLENKIKNGFKEVFTVSTYITIIEYIKGGEYLIAAKKMVSIGVKGNAVGISATLLYYMTTCLYDHKGWI